MYAWGVSAPEAKVAEIRAIAREGGSGIAAWRTMLQREATGATARATTAPMGASPLGEAAERRSEWGWSPTDCGKCRCVGPAPVSRESI